MANIFTESVIKSISNISPMFDMIMGLSSFEEGPSEKIVKQEIRRVIQMANRRIQNVKSSNLASPALKALEAERGVISRYSVFSIAGMEDIEQLKYEYGRAMAYLQNPTSTSTGARQYIRYTANDLGVTFNGANHIVDLATDPQITDAGFVNIMNYGTILDYMKDSLMSVREDFTYSADEYAEYIEEKLMEAMAMDKVLKDRGGRILNNFFI